MFAGCNAAPVRFSLEAPTSVRAAAPWRWKLSTAALAPGAHVLAASAEDLTGHVTQSSGVTVNAAG